MIDDEGDYAFDGHDASIIGIFDPDIVTAGVTADSMDDTDERLKGLPRIFRYAMLGGSEIRPQPERFRTIMNNVSSHLKRTRISSVFRTGRLDTAMSHQRRRGRSTLLVARHITSAISWAATPQAPTNRTLPICNTEAQRTRSMKACRRIDNKGHKLRVVDLFCGAGGFSCGMQQAGHHVVAAIDYDKDALAVHVANAGQTRYRRGLVNMLRLAAREAGTKGVRRHENLTRILATAPEIAELNPEIIVGGPPCQPWSKSGKKRGDADPLAKLTEAFGIIVATARPRYFVMENVPQISGSRVFRRMKHIVRRSGYGLTEMKIDASEYGSAQKRERFLCVGALDEVDGWFFDYMAEAKSTTRLTVADVLPDFGIMLYRKGRRWAPKEPHKVPRQRQSKDNKPTESKGYQLREADKRVLAKAGQSFKAYWRYPGGESSSGIRRTDEPVPTIIKSSGGGVGKNYRRRKNDIINLRNLPVLSLDELSLLSGFPPGWNWQPSRESRSEKKARNGKKPPSSPIAMLANAVPPPLAKAIGQCLTAHSRKAIPSVDRSEWRIPTAYVEWLTRTTNLADDAMTQRLSDLREAKNFVGGHNLPTTRAELIAFDKVPVIAHGKIPPERRTAMHMALTNFAEWESNSHRYPTRQKMAQLMKTTPYLRKYPMPLRAELATLELDQEYLEASAEYQTETRKKVITLFEKGDPTPYWSACVKPDFGYYDPPEDDYNPPPLLLRRKIAARRKIQQVGNTSSL